ncbi:General secretory system II protein E domain protein [Solidesulfovibrio fructosivorans JJ]]|uniref:General secretory system II protein E domain protein n=1 Tax=Solidesulfovibrio fructosivorans JJ] TaxID=596151 RepID=E1K0S4_SOLFR|nr:glycosyl transferase family protein [Solidesulfovibrio fructosivorans]EFL49762.1 General secretory system II protein E domain protein [Solidesulfovibrio fructosivorans JJ]]
MTTFELIMPYALLGLQLLLIGLGVIFLLSGFDELFIDIVYMLRQAYRYLIIRRKHPRLTEEQLLAPPEKPVAIMIPCWDESAVIRRMLDNTIRTLNYSNYQIFVGTYPNDPKTQREVDLAREAYGNVNRIVCPKDGPTNKADCLNWVYAGIKHYEKEHGTTFEIFVMNDSEDLVHPLYLKLFNYLIPRKDMIQLPVFPLIPKWWRFTPGHYADEFAENHARDMLVREILSKSVPSAGVGSGYSRRALEMLAEANNNQLFNIDSLTEDYDFGLRMHKFGLRQVFVRQVLHRRVSRKSRFTGKPRAVTKPEFIVIREYFPRTFRAAVRQKSRWIMGIALQGWASLGWQGGFWTRYMLYRDRKALLTNQISMLANCIVPVVAALWLYQLLFPDAYHYPPIVEAGTWPWYLLLANIFFFFWRAGMRMLYVWRVYGFWQGLLSVPRLIWGNTINFVATMRALRLYARFLATGKTIAWDKTDHVYPSEAELVSYRRRLGDLLLDRRFVTVAQLDAALARQKETGQPLGQVLLDMGLTSQHELVQVLGQQFRLEPREIDPYLVPLDAIAALPREVAVANGVFPLEILPSGSLAVAVESPPSPQALMDMEKAAGRSIELFLAAKSDLAFAIRRGFERLDESTTPEEHSVGKFLKDRQMVTEEQFEDAARKRRACYTRLGDILVRGQVLDYARLQEAEARFRSRAQSTGRFGDFLVGQGYITTDQLAQALREQETSCPPLREVLCQLGYATPDMLADAAREMDAASPAPVTK